MATEKTKKITEVRHPYYSSSVSNWRKFRLTMEGGTRYIRQYLRRFSRREDDQEFSDRMAVSYCPAFAKSAVLEVRNAIFQRCVDVARKGGDDSYQAAAAGTHGGVDKLGSTMNAFIGRKILPELLAMGRVGIWVDMPPLYGPTKLDAKGKHPYVYWYPAEDVLSWVPNPDDPDDFDELLLADSVLDYTTGDEFYLPTDQIQRYRHVWKDEDGYVNVRLYEDGEKGEPIDDAVRLDIKRIPFVMLEISQSLLADVADYQIALLNLASSDMAYGVRANFPFYVEQYDPRTQSQFIRQEGVNSRPTVATNPAIAPDGSFTTIVTHEKVQEVKVGVASGRRYPLGVNQPAFIAPPTDPMKASMAKQDQLKSEIRELVLGSVSQLAPKPGVDRDKEQADTGLEAGLSYIGLELEHAERLIAGFWAMYMGSNPATVTYPESYDLKTDDDRRKEADDLEKLMAKLPSKTYQKEIAKRMAKALLGPKVSGETLEKIYREIDSAVVVTTDPEIVKADFESGFVGLDTASKIRGYPAGEVEKAKKDHADRIARIAIAQSEGGGAGAPAKPGGGMGNPQARGVGDMSGNSQGGKDEKALSRETDTDDTPTDKTRGEGKNNKE